MNLVQLTPGAGGMYCGNCLRDNALIGALQRQGFAVCMVPLYLPLTLDETDQSAGTPLFFGGINVYLEQKSPFFQYVPRFVHRFLASRGILRRIGSRAAATHPSQVGDLTVSMLLGEHGRQVRELDALCRWLQTEQRPDVVCFSNALLLGMHARIKAETGARTACLLNGEDAFLDALSEPFRGDAWELVRKHAAEVDHLIAPSRFFAGYMEQRLGLPRDTIPVVHNGLHLDGYGPAPGSPEDRSNPVPELPTAPTIGYFARINRGKGLDVLVDAFIELRRRNRFPGLKLRVGGGLTVWDKPFLERQKRRLADTGLLSEAEFHPNVDRQRKIELIRSLTLFSVPSRMNEAFGLYILESQAAGVPALFPNHGAFPELIAETGGGLLFEPDDPQSLADLAESLLADA